MNKVSTENLRNLFEIAENESNFDVKINKMAECLDIAEVLIGNANLSQLEKANIINLRNSYVRQTLKKLIELESKISLETWFEYCILLVHDYGGEILATFNKDLKLMENYISFLTITKNKRAAILMDQQNPENK